MTFNYVVGGVSQALPTFATQSGAYSIRFNPIPFSTLGIHRFEVVISDSQVTSSKTFDLEIYNTEPYFTREQPVDQTMRLNNT